MKKIILVILFLAIYLHAQTDWVRWEKKNMDFRVPVDKIYLIENSQGFSIMSFMQQSYSFLISDLDGDNCPFYPTCSSFFVQSVNETNIIKGTLMFADRFTRDSNIFKSRSHYPKHISGKLFDPIQNYLLTDSTIIFHSREKTVK